MAHKPTDPVEVVISEALQKANINYVCDGNGFDTKGLDFYLPDYNIYIECKRFHTPRTSEQMSRVDNIIVIQGMDAAKTFSILVGKTFL